MPSIDHRCSRLVRRAPRASNGELLDRDTEEQEQEHCDCESDHLVLHSRCAVDVRTPLSDAAYASEWDKQPRRGDEMPWRGRRVPSPPSGLRGASFAAGRLSSDRDGANKQAVEEMRRRHELPLRAADKTGKSDFIEIMNGEFIQARLKLNPIRCSQLADEYAGLIWDERSVKREEHPNCANDLADAALYAWRLCYSYLS